MVKLRGLLGIRRTDRLMNARVRELRGVKKELSETFDDNVLCGLVILKEWKLLGLIKGICGREWWEVFQCVGS